MTSNRFDEKIARMPDLLKELKGQPLRMRDDLRQIPKQGIYVFYDEGTPIYVGRSDRLRKRIQQHGWDSSGHNRATLAFRIAKETMERAGKIPPDATRRELETAPGFRVAFLAERRRVAKMGFRIVEIVDPIEQSLFEMYAHLVLKTKYNSFENH